MLCVCFKKKTESFFTFFSSDIVWCACIWLVFASFPFSRCVKKKIVYKTCMACIFPSVVWLDIIWIFIGPRHRRRSSCGTQLTNKIFITINNRNATWTSAQTTSHAWHTYLHTNEYMHTAHKVVMQIGLYTLYILNLTHLLFHNKKQK